MEAGRRHKRKLTPRSGGPGSARERRDESGMALVIVIGVLAILGLMVAQLSFVSQTAARESKVIADRTRLRYVAESAAGQAIWLYMTDRRLHADRTIAKREATSRGDIPEDIWMSDGREHRIENDGSVAIVRLTDGMAGVDVSGPRPAEDLRALVRAVDGPEADEEFREAVEAFLAVAGDYVDSDDLVSLHGMERDDYAAAGIPSLPRNAPLQFREELYWLAGREEALQTRVRVVPPPGVVLPRGPKAGRQPFFSADAGALRLFGQLTGDELAEVLAARDRWYEDGTPPEESLDPALMARLRNRFVFEESGVVTVSVTAVSAGEPVTRRYALTMHCDPRAPSAFTGPGKDAWAVWECRLE